MRLSSLFVAFYTAMSTLTLVNALPISHSGHALTPRTGNGFVREGAPSPEPIPVSEGKKDKPKPGHVNDNARKDFGSPDVAVLGID